MLALLFLASTALIAAAVFTTSPPIANANAVSPTVLDCDGRLLRAFTTPDGRWRLALDTGGVDPRYLAMLQAYEDRRFRSHSGVDVLALARAASQLARNGRIVSGASTLTMQVARLLDGPERRSLAAKLNQIVLAFALERQLSKDQILSFYLRLAPFGGNIEGVRAASLTYFGKEPQRLSIAERALLVAIPQSPEARRPDRHAKAARAARDRVLARAVEARLITPLEAAEARREPVPTARKPFPRLAPHLAEREVARLPDATVHRLTLDRDRQTALETLAAEHAQRLGPKLSVAMIAVEHASGRIVAHVGSAGYMETSRQGANDMSEAVRSPGSTLKPFVYGLAFERGLAHPETLIEDRPARFGRYAPSNFDEDFRGTVSVREALAHSLNIPAVKVLAEVGPQRFVGRLRRAGLDPRLPTGAEPSLAVALGGVGMTLTDLVQAYATLARGGEAVPLVHSDGHSDGVRPPVAGSKEKLQTSGRGSDPIVAVGGRPPVAGSKEKLQTSGRGSDPIAVPPPPRLLSAAAAWHVADILKDAPPPASARGQRLAFKTGTSYGYRDAWAAGFDGRHTIAVWVGRADATAVPGMTGHGSAAPILFDAFARLAERTTPLGPPPSGVVRTRNADLPLPLRRFREAGDGTTGEPTVSIAFPPDKAELEAAAGDDASILLRAEGGALPLTWLIDGAPLESADGTRQAAWKPEGQGFARISVIDAEGRADRVTIRLR